MRSYQNNHISTVSTGWATEEQPRAFHRRLPGYEPTPLVDAPRLAHSLGIGSLWIKSETRRFGLPSFKILGTSWAVYQVLRERLGAEIEPWKTLEELAQRVASMRPLTLVSATDGNHGRAVARMATLLGFQSHIFVPGDMVESRMQAIRQEGARITRVNGSYDEAIARAAEQADEQNLLISDTAWPGYETIPRQVIAGYATIFEEIDEQLAGWQQAGPDLVIVQIGVGALATAVVQHYRQLSQSVKIVGVEPTSAACALASMESGHMVSLSDPPHSIMAGLNCGTPSLVAWPTISTGIDLFMAIDDEWARRGMRDLATHDLTVGETGAAGMGGLVALLTDPVFQTAKAALKIDASTRALVICTEGATDPDAYLRIVGKSANNR